MTEIDDQSRRRLYAALEDKLTQISEDMGYREGPPGSKEYSELDKAWSSYLLGVHVIRMDKNIHIDEGLWLMDPLYPTGGWILMDVEVANRILILGLP